MTDDSPGDAVPPEGSAEVAGEFLLGLVGSFYNLRVLPQGGLKLRIEDIEPRQWYPYSLLLDTIRDIERVLPAETSKSLFFRAGIHFLTIWYEQGPGKEMIHSGIDWFYSQTRSGGYNTVVRGKLEEVGWTEMLSMDMEKGVVVHECVMPMHPEYARGIYYCGCLLFDDMEFFDVTETHAPYEANPNFIRTVLTTRFRLRSKDARPDLDQCIDRLDAGEKLALTPAEVESLIWRYKGLRFKAGIDSAYYNSINAVLAHAITEGERYAAELARARDASDAASRAKSAFLANMSHEIRTPMNAILGMSHLALKGSGDPQQRDYLGKIQRAGQHLLSVINDILDISKVEAGKFTIENSYFALSTLLDDVANVIGDKAAAKGLRLSFDVAPDVPAQLVGDRLRLGQVLINYATNAVKFTEHGEVAVSVSADARTQRDVVLRFAVRDTGIGLTQEQVGLIFDAFQQADSSITRRYGGTGLGLAICRNLVHLMGGEVGVDSAVGTGSTFWFTVPLGIGQLRRQSERLDLRGRRLLVVERAGDAGYDLCATLTSMGFTVVTAGDAVEAIAACREALGSGRPFDIVLLDVDTLESATSAVAERIRSLAGTREQGMVMVASADQPDLVEQAQRDGYGLVVRPIDPSSLFDVLASMLGSDRTTALRAESLEALRGARVLLAEDNEFNQEVAKAILADAGLVVDVAADGLEAVQLARSNHYDVILMDMQMPVMDGVTATREIRHARPSAELPILAMTANAMQEDCQRCLDAGMDDFVTKPIDPDHLLAVLHRWIKARGADAGNA